MGRRWTPGEDRDVRAMAGDGATAERIGQALGRSASAIRHRTQTLGVRRWRRRYWTEAEDAEIRAAAGSGSYTGLAARIGRTENAVRTRAQRLAVRTRGPSGRWRRWTEAEDEAVAEVAAEVAEHGPAPRGEGRYRALAEQLGRSVDAVRIRAMALRRRAVDPDPEPDDLPPALALELARLRRPPPRRPGSLGAVDLTASYGGAP